MFDVFLTFFLIASGISANKGLLFSVPSVLFVSVRMLIPGLLMFSYLLIQKKTKFRALSKDALIIIGCALFTTFIPSNLKAYALKNLISSKQAFLGSLEPFFAAIYGYFIFNEKLTLRRTIGLALGLTGALILLVTTSAKEEMIGSIWIFSYPELAMLTAVAIGRFGWTVVQKILREEKYTPIEFNSLLMIASGILSLSLSLSTEDMSAINIKNPLFFLALFTYTISIGNMVAYNLYGYVLKKYSTTFIALAGLSVPLWVYIFGYLFLGEPLSMNFFLAMAITLCGLIIFYFDEPQKTNQR